jgi:hypothetical protein
MTSGLARRVCNKSENVFFVSLDLCVGITAIRFAATLVSGLAKGR